MALVSRRLLVCSRRHFAATATETTGQESGPGILELKNAVSHCEENVK